MLQNLVRKLVFFIFVNSLYTFFSASTSRWLKLTDSLSKHKDKLGLKKLSSTRWSACADATKALHRGYGIVRNVANEISQDTTEKAECRSTAKGIYETMGKLETGIMVILWSKILERFNLTSVNLQYANLDLNRACSMYDSLNKYVESVREDFEDIEQKAMDLTKCNLYKEDSGRKRKRNRKYDEDCGSGTPDLAYESLTLLKNINLKL